MTQNIFAILLASTLFAYSTMAAKVLNTLQTSAATEAPAAMNNIGYLASGYNIFKGNPLSEDKFDPGFSKNTIFDFEYNKKDTSEDERFLIPDFIDVSKDDACLLSYDSNTIKGETSLTKSIS